MVCSRKFLGGKQLSSLFVEAEADCAIEEIGDITKPDPVTLGKLVYDVPGAKNILEIPPLVAQVCTSLTQTMKISYSEDVVHGFRLMMILFLFYLLTTLKQ